LAREPGDYMAPPDIEAGTAPIEGSSSGVVVGDGALLFMGEGPLPSPVGLHLRGGELVGTEGEEAGRLQEMLDRCADPRMRNLAEASVAFNPNGRVCGVAMETESSRGTAHVALGNSIAYGGTVDAVAHLDCVMRDATLELDGEPVIVAGVLAGARRVSCSRSRVSMYTTAASRWWRWRSETQAPKSSTWGSAGPPRRSGARRSRRTPTSSASRCCRVRMSRSPRNCWPSEHGSARTHRSSSAGRFPPRMRRSSARWASRRCTPSGR